jgi:hypothetical protein
LPAGELQNSFNAIKALSNVRAFAKRDEARGAISQFLATHPQSQRVCFGKRKTNVEECLVKIEHILISWPGPAVAAVLEAAFELRKEADILSEVGVGVNHVTLEQVAIIILWPQAPLAIVIVFVALANLASEGQIEIASTVERYEFNGVEEVGSVGRVAEIRVVLVVAKLEERGRNWWRR